MSAFKCPAQPLFGYDGYVIHLLRQSARGPVADASLAAVCKVQTVTPGREEAMAGSWPDGQKPDTEPHQVGRPAEDRKVLKGNRNLDA